MPKGTPKHVVPLSSKKQKVADSQDETNLVLLEALNLEIKAQLQAGGLKGLKLLTLMKEYRGLVNALKAASTVNIATGNLIDRSDRRSMVLRQKSMDPIEADKMRAKAITEMTDEH